MKIVTNLSQISGGYLPPNYVLMPMMGCGLNMGHTYLRNPDASYRDYGISCGKGALHGLNPGLGLTSMVVQHPANRYALGVVYGIALYESTNYLFPDDKSQQTCRFNMPGNLDE